MLGIRTQVVLALAVLLVCARPAFGTQKHPPKSAAKQETPPPQPPPPTPLTLAQMPATPPQVTYDKGTLTIVAQNSTLGDILRAVHAKTGTVMDISGTATERVVSRFGPGPPRDVLAQLLSGSSFNYVILGSAADAGMVQKVVLSPKPAGGQEEASAPAPANPAAPNPFPRVQAPAPGVMDPSDDDSDDANDADAQDQPATAPAAAEGQPSQPTVKTPEQLLQELQRQQQTQQQQGGGEPQPNPRQQ